MHPRANTVIEVIGVSVLIATAALALSGSATAALPDGRGYEMVSPVEKNGVSPYAAIPAPSGTATNFQARSGFADATSGSLNLYQATRTSDGWQTTPLTPTPPTPLGALEEQAPVWFSADLSKAIFTTPASFAAGDQDGGALSLYLKTVGGGLTWLSQGSQGGGEVREATFDGATPDGEHVAFSTGASLLPAATNLISEAFPEPEFLYERDVANNQTSLLSIDNGGQPVGAVETTLAEDYTPGLGFITVARTEGLFPGQTIAIGTGPASETTQISSILRIEGTTEQILVGNGSGLSNAYSTGTPIAHLSEGAILGDGGHLTSGPPPAGEYLPAYTGSGSTTHALSSDGATAFFESPNPASGEPVGLYVRKDNSSTTRVAGGAPDGTTLSGFDGAETVIFGSARYEGAASDGALAFFTSDEGLAGTTTGRELYEFNASSHEIGGVAPLSLRPISAGNGGDRYPITTLTTAARNVEAITVENTAGFYVGEAIAFAPFEVELGRRNTNETAVVAAVDSPTELTLTQSLSGTLNGIPIGTEVYGFHPASVTAIANNGSDVYFVSDGALATNQNAQGAMAAPVQPNLYVFDTGSGETRFVGTLAQSDVNSEGHPSGLVGEPDVSRPAVPSPDGGVLVFASAANLTGQNPWQEFTEIYRYSVAGNTLACLSCTAPGIKPTGNATFGETAGGTYEPPGLTSPMSEDGSRVFFQTPDSLVSEDENGGAPLSAKFETPTSTDVYEWEAGKVSLISSGTATTPTVLQGTTPSGNDVLFTSTAQLVPGQSDGGYENVFDARVGGGFPEAAHAAPSCVGSGCRAAFGVAPIFEAPASTSPQGAGNAPTVLGVKAQPNAAKCRKGLVRKRVKGKAVCVRKARKAGRGARAGRAVGANVHRSR